MSRTLLKINGQSHTIDVEPDCPLLYVLRDSLALNNPRFGCGLGQCGACTVLIDNRAVRSCTLPVSAASGKEIVTLEGLATEGNPHPVPITTIEGLAKGDKLHPLQEAFIEADAMQCGYCIPGMILGAAALLNKNPHPSDEEMRSAFQNLICRCGSHVRIFAAVRHAADEAKRSA